MSGPALAVAAGLRSVARWDVAGGHWAVNLAGPAATSTVRPQLENQSLINERRTYRPPHATD